MTNKDRIDGSFFFFNSELVLYSAHKHWYRGGHVLFLGMYVMDEELGLAGYGQCVVVEWGGLEA